MHRGAAAVTASLAGGKERVVDPKPLLIAAVSTLPSRAGEPLRHSLSSMYGQIRPPDAVVLSTPQQYKRGDLSVRPVAARPPPPHALLWQVSPQTDSGPGTKALGALSTARALAREEPRRPAYLVLFDDDLTYDPHALLWVEQSLARLPPRRRNATALTFCLYSLPCAGYPPPPPRALSPASTTRLELQPLASTPTLPYQAVTLTATLSSAYPGRHRC